MLGLCLTHRACEKIETLEEYLTSCKADFWRSVRNRSKQERNKNTCDAQWFVFFEVLLIGMVPKNGSGRVSQTELS